jgi:esterase/lipase
VKTNIFFYRIISLFAFVFYLFTSISLFAIDDDAFSEDTQFYETRVENIKGIALVVHGLNVKPSKMGTPSACGTLVKYFLDNGFHVLRVTLSGHNGDISGMKNIAAEKWLSDAYNAYSFLALQDGQKNNLPVVLVGFSLGALVYEQLMNTNSDVVFQKAILFSPALAIKETAKNILLLDVFLKDDSIINSRSPADYRAQKGCSLSAYKALFNLEKSIYDFQFANNNIDTLIFVDKKDELLDIKKLTSYKNKFKLTKWNIIEIEGAKGNVKPAFHHLLIDKYAVGVEGWNILTDEMRKFIE